MKKIRPLEHMLSPIFSIRVESELEMALLEKALKTGYPALLEKDTEPPKLINTKLSDIGCFIANEVVIRYRLGRRPMETGNMTSMSRF
jgi:hypothetical protein